MNPIFSIIFFFTFSYGLLALNVPEKNPLPASNPELIYFPKANLNDLPAPKVIEYNVGASAESNITLFNHAFKLVRISTGKYGYINDVLGYFYNISDAYKNFTGTDSLTNPSIEVNQCKNGYAKIIQIGGVLLHIFEDYEFKFTNMAYCDWGIFFLPQDFLRNLNEACLSAPTITLEEVDYDVISSMPRILNKAHYKTQQNINIFEKVKKRLVIFSQSFRLTEGKNESYVKYAHPYYGNFIPSEKTLFVPANQEPFKISNITILKCEKHKVKVFKYDSVTYEVDNSRGVFFYGITGAFKFGDDFLKTIHSFCEKKASSTITFREANSSVSFSHPFLIGSEKARKFLEKNLLLQRVDIFSETFTLAREGEEAKKKIKYVNPLLGAFYPSSEGLEALKENSAAFGESLITVVTCESQKATIFQYFNTYFGRNVLTQPIFWGFLGEFEFQPLFLERLNRVCEKKSSR